MTPRLETKLLMTGFIKKNSIKIAKHPKIYIFILVFIIVTTALIIYLFSTGESSAVQYKTDQAHRDNLVVIVTSTGTLEPTNKVDVGSELSGTIKTVEVDYNSKVKTGQVLARLDTTKLEATISQSRAALESAIAKNQQSQATLMETKLKLSQYQKVWELSEGKVPSRTEMDAAKAAHQRALADTKNTAAAISQSRAALNANLTDLSKSIIKSPINGIVLTRNIEPGQTVAASFTAPVLFTLAEDLTKMDLHLNIDEADIGKIQEGQQALFSVAAYPNRTFEARVIQARYGSSTTSGVVTYETVLKVDNPDFSLRPGMTATADITVKKLENVLLISSSALRFSPLLQQEKKSSASLISSLIPQPPKQTSSNRESDYGKKLERTIWILENKKLVPVSIITGESNGGFTVVVSGHIEPGTEIVSDVVSDVVSGVK